MHVAYNAVFLEPQLGGVVTYAEALVPAVARELGRPVTVFVNRTGHRHLAERWAGEPVELVDVGPLGARGARALGELAALGALADRRGVDVLHSLAFTGPLRSRAAHVVTVHDVIWMADTDSELRFTARLWRLLVPRVVRRADRVVAVTDAAGDEIARVLRVPREKLDVVRHGIRFDPAAPATPEAALRAKLGLGDEPVVLCVAALKEHKNLAALQTAMRELPDATLVLAGAPTPHAAQLAAQAPANVRQAGFVADADLEGLYRLASAFALPSLEEGFGLPVLEAMVRGVPVACSDIPALREVAGDAAVLFDPRDTAAIAGAVRSVLGDAGSLQARGEERAGGFTWEASARAAVAGYERALRDRRGG